LDISGEGYGSILINGRVVYQPNSRLISQEWSIDSLAVEHKKDSVLISLYALSNFSAKVIQKERNDSKYKSEEELLRNIKAQYQSDKNLWIVMLLFLGLTLGIYRMKYPKSFASLFDVSDIFRLRLRESFFYELRITQAPNLIHYFVLAVLFTLFFSKNWEPFSSEEPELNNYHIMLITIFVVSMVYPFLKYAVVGFFSGLFGLDSFAKFHFMESIRLTILILSVAVLSSFIPDELQRVIEPNMLLVSLFLSSLCLMYIKLINRTLDKKLYLFSYICTTEIIPLLFIINFFK
jgi:hypothetical protein